MSLCACGNEATERRNTQQWVAWGICQLASLQGMALPSIGRSHVVTVRFCSPSNAGPVVYYEVYPYGQVRHVRQMRDEVVSQRFVNGLSVPSVDQLSDSLWSDIKFLGGYLLCD